MATILNSAILDSAILHKTLTQTSSIWFKLIHSHLTWWWQSSWILLSSIQSFCTKKTSLNHSDSTWWWQPFWTVPSWIQPFCTKKNFTHSFWLNLMMAAILNSAMSDSDTAILDSNTLSSSLRFTQKHSHSTLTLTQTNWIWLKLIHSDSTWWWQPSWNLPTWIWPSWIQPS